MNAMSDKVPKCVYCKNFDKCKKHYYSQECFECGRSGQKHPCAHCKRKYRNTRRCVSNCAKWWAWILGKNGWDATMERLRGKEGGSE